MEKCSPTPNMRRMTPISASCVASPASATKPGVNGPMTTPARRYPTSGGNRNRVAASPNRNDNPKPAARMAMSAVLWGIIQKSRCGNATEPQSSCRVAPPRDYPLHGPAVRDRNLGLAPHPHRVGLHSRGAQARLRAHDLLDLRDVVRRGDDRRIGRPRLSRGRFTWLRRALRLRPVPHPDGARLRRAALAEEADDARGSLPRAF